MFRSTVNGILHQNQIMRPMPLMVNHSAVRSVGAQTQTIASTAKSQPASKKPQAKNASQGPVQPLTAAQCEEAVKQWTRPYSPGLLTAQELKQYFDDGFVVKHNVFSPSELQPIIASIDEIVDELANALHRSGRITDLHKGVPYTERLALIEKQFPSASVIIHKRGVLPRSFAELWAHPRLMSAARQIVGPDLAGHPVWNLRPKTPGLSEATVPWHQDNAYLDTNCWSVLQLTAWVPFVNTNRQNGCMEVIRGGHKKGLTALHTGCWSNTWYVELTDDVMQHTLGVDVKRDTVLCEVPLGSVLFLNNLIPHRSLPNNSKGIRWSLDLRWQDPTKPNGFFGKDSIVMAKASDPAFKPDWGKWTKVDNQRTFLKDGVKESDTIIFGPWMGTWPLTNRNKHTDAFENADEGTFGYHT